jgi:aminopeptidase N
MRTEEPRAIDLSDYRAPEFRITTVHLDFALEPEATRVKAKLVWRGLARGSTYRSQA